MLQASVLKNINLIQSIIWQEKQLQFKVLERFLIIFVDIIYCFGRSQLAKNVNVYTDAGFWFECDPLLLEEFYFMTQIELQVESEVMQLVICVWGLRINVFLLTRRGFFFSKVPSIWEMQINTHQDLKTHFN